MLPGGERATVAVSCWKWHCSPYLMILPLPFGQPPGARLFVVWKCAEDKGIWLRFFWHRFAFGDSFWLRVYVSALSVERIANARMSDSFGIVQLVGKPGEKGKYCKVSRKELEARRQENVCFPFASPGVLTGEGETHME